MVNYIIIGVLEFLLLNYFIRYRKSKKKMISSYYNPLRRGYYKCQYVAKSDNSPFETTVFVDEIERYKSGESKIKLADIEYGVSELVI